jgi:iron complex outermembrane recepter protein
MIITRSILGVSAMTLAQVLAYSGAYAQSAEKAESDDGVIVVTAQKREQDILEVPVAVSSFSDSALEAANVSDFADITRVSPSLTINGASNNNESTIALRGIGTFSFSTSVEPSVSVVIDDVAVVQQGQAFSNLSDIARIEVLRGPQGTLFGKNASAGVVNIVTKAPSSVLTGDVEGTLTSDGERKVNATVSGPLGGSLGFRVNSYYVNRDGFIRNLQTGDKLNGEEGYGLRGKLVAELGAADVTLIADYSEREVLGNAPTFLQLPAGSRFFGSTFNQDGVEVGPGADTVRFDRNPVADNKQLSLIGKIDYDLGFATLSSITGYQKWDYTFGQDVDGTNLASVYQEGPYASTSLTQEVRLTSPSSDGLEYIVGLYLSDAETDRAFTRGPIARANWDSTATSKSYAAFTQLSYHLSDTTTISAGGRVNNEKIGVRFEERNLPTPVSYVGKASDTAVTGKVSLQQFLTPEIMVFASAATGYKGQAYDISSGFTQRRADNPVRAETSISYEIGLKGRVLDNRLSFSLTGFWTDYDDFQAQSAVVTQNSGIVVELNNVGKLRTKGVEFEGSFEVADGFDIFGSAAYTDATIQRFAGANCYGGQTAAQGCVFDATLNRSVQDLSGGGLANSPEFKYTLGASLETPVGDSPISAFANVNYNWQSDVTYDLFGNPLTQQDSYGIFNLSFGLKESENSNWQVTAFVNNVFDETYSAGITDGRNFFGGSVVLTQQLARNYSRYGGLRIKLGF